MKETGKRGDYLLTLSVQKGKWKVFLLAEKIEIHRRCKECMGKLSE